MCITYLKHKCKMERELGLEFGMLRGGRQVLTVYSVTSYDGPGPERPPMPRRQSGHDGSDQASSSWSACVRMVQLRTCYCQHQPEGGAIGCRRTSSGRRQAFGCPCPTACHSRPCVCHGKRFGPSCQRIEGTKGAHPARRIGALQNTTGVLPGDRFGPSSCKQRGRARARTFGACRGANDRAALAVARALAAGGLCCPAHHKASVPQPASCLHGQPHTRPR